MNAISIIVFRIHEEVKISPKHNSEIIKEADEMEPTGDNNGPMFEFDDEPPVTKQEDNMDFVQYPQSPNARSKIVFLLEMFLQT